MSETTRSDAVDPATRAIAVALDDRRLAEDLSDAALNALAREVALSLLAQGYRVVSDDLLMRAVASRGLTHPDVVEACTAGWEQRAAAGVTLDPRGHVLEVLLDAERARA